MRRSDRDARVALVTAPDLEVGARIARALVEERLAACVNLVPGVRSIYRWEGRVEDAAEVLLVVKTRAQRLSPLQERVRELHPYEVPEVISIAISEGNEEYLEWLGKQVERGGS